MINAKKKRKEKGLHSSVKRGLAQNQEDVALPGRLKVNSVSATAARHSPSFAWWRSESADQSLGRPGYYFHFTLPPSCVRDYVEPRAGRNAGHHVPGARARRRHEVTQTLKERKVKRCVSLRSSADTSWAPAWRRSLRIGGEPCVKSRIADAYCWLLDAVTLFCSQKRSKITS